MLLTRQLTVSCSAQRGSAGTLGCERDVMTDILPPHHQEVRILSIVRDRFVGSLNDSPCHLPDLGRGDSLSLCGMATPKHMAVGSLLQPGLWEGGVCVGRQVPGGIAPAHWSVAIRADPLATLSLRFLVYKWM